MSRDRILSDDDFVIKSKYYSLIYSSCFNSYLEFSKMSLFFGICFILYFLNLWAGRGFQQVYLMQLDTCRARVSG